MSRSSRSRSPARFDSDGEAHETFPQETTAETVPMSELWNLFVNQVKVAEEEEEVVRRVIDRLGEYGITKAVQLEDADDELVKLVFPMQDYLREHSMTKRAIRHLKQQVDLARTGLEKMAEAVKQLAAAQQQMQQGRHNKGDLEADLPAPYNVAKSLKSYNLR